MLPTMGAAMRCMTSEPVPCPNIMGIKAAMITATYNVSGINKTYPHLAKI